MLENRCQSSLAVILPSLNPDEKFAAVLKGLLDRGFEHIVVVDDGSDEDRKSFFKEAEAHPEVKLLVHEVNKGKGRALKDAFSYVAENMPELEGVITIDGDGQHLIDDIIACGDRMLEEKDNVILGCRDFNQPGVPPKSLAGNKTTSKMFRICYGIKLSDTQTGLRAIPAKYLKRFSEIEGERFEYETNMLLQMKRLGIKFSEQPIETVYEDENAGTHFDPVKDTWRIIKIMFKFLLSSLGSLLIDQGVFYLVNKFFASFFGNYAVLASTAIARACSSFANFNANNSLVFGNKSNYKRAMFRYYCLCIVQMLVSAGLVSLLSYLFAVTAVDKPSLMNLIKLGVDTCLFFVSYHIQREWVFSQKGTETEEEK